MTSRTQAVLGWVLGAIAFAAVISQIGCSGIGSTDLEPPGIGAVIDPSVCAAYGYTCGKVYQFDDQPADNPLGLVELCVRKSDLETAIMRFGPAQSSTDPRFAAGNLCLWCCGTGCPPRGCNAYGGAVEQTSCFCAGVP